jgi:hypothetical protein
LSRWLIYEFGIPVKRIASLSIFAALIEFAIRAGKVRLMDRNSGCDRDPIVESRATSATPRVGLQKRDPNASRPRTGASERLCATQASATRASCRFPSMAHRLLYSERLRSSWANIEGPRSFFGIPLEKRMGFRSRRSDRSSSKWIVRDATEAFVIGGVQLE